MSIATSTLAARVRAADAARTTPGGPAHDDLWLLVQQRMATDPEDSALDAPRGLPCRRLLLAATAVVAVGAGAVTWLPRGDQAAYAATPPLLTTRVPVRGGAAERLRAIADAVRVLPDDAGARAGALVSTRSWSLLTRIDGAQVTREVVPYETLTSIAADGTRTVRTPLRARRRARRHLGGGWGARAPAAGPTR